MFGRRQEGELARHKAARRAAAEGAVSLAQTRRWYTQNDGGQGAGGAAGQNGGGSGSSAGTQNTEPMIPKSRFDEINQKRIDAEAALKRHQDDQQTAEQARLAEQGRYKEVADNAIKRVAELEPFKAIAEANQAVIAKANEALIAQLPEDIRDSLITPLKGLPAHDLYAWLNTNVPMLLKRPAPNIDAGASGGSGKPVVLTAEEKIVAAASGMTEAQWIAAKQKAEQGG